MIVARRVQPASFAWFTPSCYAPGLGFLMFAVGVNLQLKAFATVFKTPKVKGRGLASVCCLMLVCSQHSSLTELVSVHGTVAFAGSDWSMGGKALVGHVVGIHSCPSIKASQ